MHLLDRYPAFFALLWATILAMMLGYSGWRVMQSPVFDTDIMSLFPHDKQSDTARYAQQKIVEGFGQKVTVLTKHYHKDVAIQAAQAYQQQLQNVAGLTITNLSHNHHRFQQLIDLYAQHRSSLLTAEQQQWLSSNNIAALRNQLLLQFYGIGAPLFADIAGDPLALFSRYVQTQLLTALSHVEIVDGVAVVADNGTYYALTEITLQDDAFHLDFQQRIKRQLDQAGKAVQQAYPQTEIIRSGLLFHLYHGSQMAQREIGWMGSISFLSVCLLLIGVFRSVRPLAATVTIVTLEGIAGLSACLLIFGKVHLLTIVFGTSLIGISVDYALHFFAEKYRQNNWSSRMAIQQIRTCIVLGLITTLIGFLGICLVPFPGLQQMAVFCSAGLIFSCGCVLFWYPYIFNRFSFRPNQALYRFAGHYLEYWIGPRLQRYALPVLLVLLLMGSVALWFAEGKDEVRGMQPISMTLVAQDKTVAKLLHMQLSPQFFVISGATAEETLQRQEQLTEQLDPLVTAGALEGYQAISRFIPSAQKQMENHALLQRFVGENAPALTTLLQQIGIDSSLLEHYQQSLLQPIPPLTVEALLPYLQDTPLATLWLGSFQNRQLAVVTLKTIHDLPRLRALAAPQQGIEFIDKIQDISTILSHYRYWMSLCITASYAVILGFLWHIYGFRRASLIVFPSVFAAVFSILTAAFLFGAYTLFNIMALFLVMGIAVDYSLFLTKADQDNRPTMVAVFLSAVTTLLSFGLLAFSATTVLRDFGIVVCMGILLTLLLTPLTVLYTRRR